MPLVAAFFTVVFTKFFDLFAMFITKKVALSAAAIATFIAALGVIWLLIRALILSLMWVWPPMSGSWLAFYTAISVLCLPIST